MVDFDTRILGFQLLHRDADSASLGAGGSELLRLSHLGGARRVTGTTGLYRKVDCPADSVLQNVIDKSQ